MTCSYQHNQKTIYLQLSNSPLAVHSPRVHSQCSKISASPNHSDRFQHQCYVHSLATNQISRDSEGDVTPVTTALSLNKDPSMSCGEISSNNASSPQCFFALLGLAKCEDCSNFMPIKRYVPSHQRLSRT